MNRADVQKAIDDAFAEGLKHTFEILVFDLIGEKPSDAVDKFRAGVGLHNEAYAQASSVIKHIFPE